MKSLISLFILVLSCATVFAVENSEFQPVDDSFADRARKRLYPGGVDHDDLKVQEQLPQALKKVDPKSVQKQVRKSLFEKTEDSKETSAE